MKYILLILMFLPVIGNSQMIVNSYAFGGGGGGGDVTPNAVNWNNMSWDGITDLILPIPTKQITGINQTIRLDITTNAEVYFIWYEVSSTPTITDQSNADQGSLMYFADVLGQGSYIQNFTAANTITLYVDNNEYVTFAGIPMSGTVTLTVKNYSDGNTTLDTFQCQ